jgi:hypothetical protein
MDTRHVAHLVQLRRFQHDHVPIDGEVLQQVIADALVDAPATMVATMECDDQLATFSMDD